MEEFFAVEWLPWLITTAFMCGGTYFGIKGDLLRAVRLAEDAKKLAGEAHDRIDTLHNILLKRGK
tara:strand:+ start:272 stop:466 length:195 start_codon:yes stop_codon:yes gene_type:complete